ncbi:MAG: metallophosphoesterase [Ferruginibacter sp.]|nr:metallophosphoesterase [Cytophagales bacterium]
MNRLVFVLLFVAVLALVDWYVFGAVRQWSGASPTAFRRSVLFIVGGLTIGAVAAILLLLILPGVQGSTVRNFLLLIIFTNLLVKLFMALFLFLDDLIRLGKQVFSRSPNPLPPATNHLPTIPRSEFLVRAAVVAGTIPVVGVGYGILVGAHDYRIRRVKLALKNLPSSFDGLRIAQISDIHSGSFFNKRAVQGGVDMILREKPDVIFFTGDLVNNQAGEVEDYLPVFRRVKAPLGVFSILGNHDYGDYVNWDSAQAKRQNLEKLIGAHQLLGWDLLLDEHRYLTQNGDRLAILGNQNWGTKFHRYGSLAKTHQGTEAPVKLLLSHDPSHWDAQVRPGYPDIDVMFAGHTHGAQFGVEVGGFRWSPVQYAYKQWAGLYQETTATGRDQYLYVNRGFGYIGFPGRVGMPPEITVFELKKA